MRLILAATAATLITGTAVAAGSDLRVSTDPAKIAAIEQHARELQARDRAAHAPKASASTGARKSGKNSHSPRHRAKKAKN